MVYESLLAMTAMCSSKSSSDHGRIRTETKSSWFCMVLGPRQGCLHGDSCVGTPRVLGKLLSTVAASYSAIPQFPVFWPSEMTSATFCESSPESSPIVQSRVQSTEYRRPCASRILVAGTGRDVPPPSRPVPGFSNARRWCPSNVISSTTIHITVPKFLCF